MVPPAASKEDQPQDAEDIIISGMAGKFPESENVYEFRENLFNKVDMVTNDSRRWVVDHPEIPRRTGKLRELSKFDASFFAVHYKQAHTMDPMCRMLLELAYEAIVDAGVNPMTLRGTNTGCFVGACFSESEKIWFYERVQLHGFGITGCSRAMLANRISYWLGIHGPSYSVDTACSSSLYALDHAVRAIRQGQCDAALVGGSNLTLHPYISLQFARLGVLSPDGRCKSFDADGDGYCRSETIAMIFLQKAKDAKRIYATVVHSKTNCDGFKEQGITYPSGHMQGKLLVECYKESGISFKDLQYYEAHGTGTKVGDPEELNTVDRFICSQRDEPLLVGSIKSNIGHSEPASALSAVIKCVIGMEAGLLAPNLHYKNPRSGIPALPEGRIKIVTEVTPWDGGIVGVSSFGFGGANAHAILRSNPNSKPEKDPALEDGLPRLIVASGRTEEAVETIISEFEKKPVDSEYVALLQSVHSEAIPGHIYRGYSVLHADSREDHTKLRSIQHFPGAKRPVWFIFAGMGSQWAGMGKDLMRLPVFAQAIERCDAALRPKGLDIKHIITHEDPKMFDNILNSFVGIAAVQVGLVDVLTAAGIVPDGIVGHSVGELGCAYADGCFTAEQMVLAAYSRGLASIETPLIHGSMAAVGLSHDVAAPLCPPDVEVACHNGTDSCTISGPAESVAKFVAELKEKEIFAREVACSNIAYHSRYIAKAGPKLLHYLKQVIPDAKRRSEKWVSSSVPESRWSEAETQFSSPEYHTNNLLCPVLFAEAIRHVPRDAITIEIAPHALLQAILRRSLSSECTNIALTQRGVKNGVDLLFSAIGKLYVYGLHPQLLNIHPRVQFPVSRGTPMISPLIRWQHNDDWHVAIYKNEEKLETGERTVVINVKNDEHDFLVGHLIDGRNLFPATGYLWLAWETLAMMNSMIFTNVPIVFENVKFLRACYLPSDGDLELTIMVTKGTGTFEVVEGGSAVVTGRIYIPENIDKEMLNLPPPRVETTPLTPPPMSSRDIYKELRLRGYNYNGIFKAIRELDSTGVVGKLHWENNYVAFMDALLQLEILQLDSRALYVPTALQRLVINPHLHKEMIENLGEDMDFPMYGHHSHQVLASGGIEIRGLHASVIARRKVTAQPVLETHHVLEYRPRELVDFNMALRACTHIVLENINTSKPKVVEWVSPIEADCGVLLAPKLPLIFGDLPLISAEIVLSGASTVLTEALAEADLATGLSTSDVKLSSDTSAHLVVCGDGGSLLSLPSALSDVMSAVKSGGFLLVQVRRGCERGAEQTLEGLGAVVVAVMTSECEALVLARKVEMSEKGEGQVVHVTEEDDLNFTWVAELQQLLKSDPLPHRIYLVSQNQPKSGLLGFVNCLLKEGNADKIRCVLIQDAEAPTFNPQAPAYAAQLRGDLVQNVLPGGTRGWSSYRHTLLTKQNREVTHAYVNVLTRGDLSSFRWLQGPLKDPKAAVQDGNHLFHIYYSALNFRDVMTATGKLAVEVVAKDRLRQDCVQGLEFSGRAPNGRRKMGLTLSGALANLALVHPILVWDVPEEWSLEDAATVPVVYCTVYVALIVKGHMKAGDSVLIHAGTGGVGQAAINVALHMGCTIFVTVGTPDKRAFLHKHFPQIPDANIGNSRDTSFEQMVMERTKGKGVDLVLNSLSGDKLLASLRCLAEQGRFLEIGKFDMAADTPIGMSTFLKDTSVHGIFLDSIIEGATDIQRQTFKILEQGIKSGAVKPLVRQIFGPDQVETAFRFMAGGKHIGKVLVKIRDEETDGTTRGKPIEVKPTTKLVEAIPRFFCDSDKSYIIIGGLGGFGLELADWLVLRGARKLVLSSRSGVRNGYQAWRIRTWQSYGAKIVISRAEVTCEQGCITLLESTARKLGPVAAIFNLAVVLKDGLFETQNSESFAVSFMAKARTTTLLDQVSRRLCPQLQHFVVFSSVSCGRGNYGQTNYGYSNSVMERICEARRAEGLPALAVQWGAVGDVGLVAENMTEEKEGEGSKAASGAEPLVIGGTLQQRILSCLEVLDTFLTLPDEAPVVVASMVVAEKAIRGGSSTSVVDTVVNILGIRDLKTVSMHSTLAELGMDSMMAVEIKQTLEREFEMFLSPQDIRGLTFARLQELAQKMQDQYRARQEAASGNTEDDNAWLIGGLQHLLGVVGDASLATKPVVALPSEGGDKARTVFMVPGLEGIASVMEPLAKYLNYPVQCLQMPLDAPTHSVQELSQILLERMQETQPTGPYFLLGYSYGTVLLLEMAWELQHQGHDVRVALIDGALPALQGAVKKGFAGDVEKEAEWQTVFLERLLVIIGCAETQEVTKQLLDLADWDARLDKVSTYFPSKEMKEYHKKCVTASMKRITNLMKYSWPEGRKLKCPITLVRTLTPMAGFSADDYGLNQFCERKVSVHVVEGTHTGIILNKKTADIINQDAFLLH